MSYQKEFMKAAVELALDNINHGGGPFGAVIVKDGKIVGQGCNSVTNHLDPTAHAEVMAIRNTCRELGTFILEGCEIYSSCEPCPMCLSAIYWAHIDRIYYACTKHDAAEAGFDDSFIYKQLDLPADKRKIVAEEHDRESSQKIFEKWMNKEDKTEY